jgi:hypothetical protein
MRILIKKYKQKQLISNTDLKKTSTNDEKFKCQIAYLRHKKRFAKIKII